MTDKTETMVERVAEAIYKADDPWSEAWPWPNLSENQASAEAYRRCARAAIEAYEAARSEAKP